MEPIGPELCGLLRAYLWVCDDPTIYVVDREPGVYETLCALVRSDLLLVEHYASMREFIETSEPGRPGCLFLSASGSDDRLLEGLQWRAGQRSHMPTIVLLARGDVSLAVRVMQAGALDVLVKPCDEVQLDRALHDAMAWDAENREEMLAATRIGRRIGRLSPGEHQVLQMLVDGRSNKEAAAELGLSVRTIEVRRAKLMAKMKAQSLAELVRLTLTERYVGRRRRPAVPQPATPLLGERPA